MLPHDMQAAGHSENVRKESDGSEPRQCRSYTLLTWHCAMAVTTTRSSCVSTHTMRFGNDTGRAAGVPSAGYPQVGGRLHTASCHRRLLTLKAVSMICVMPPTSGPSVAPASTRAVSGGITS